MQQTKRSVVFLHDGYYHSYYLARALRKRGWDAVSVGMKDPINHRDAIYSHGVDLGLFSPDPVLESFVAGLSVLDAVFRLGWRRAADLIQASNHE